MVELKNVSFRYGSEESDGELASSFSDVSLTVRDGEFVLLTGPTGRGKTSILRLINGLIPHFYPGTITGSVTIDGEPVQERELFDTVAQVGTVFQNPRSQFYNVDTIRISFSRLRLCYEHLQEVTLLQILDFHVRFERIHPFDNGNGRIGRLLMFKECLRHGVTPFILGDKRRSAYLEGLRLWDLDRSVLAAPCLEAQKRFENVTSSWFSYLDEGRKVQLTDPQTASSAFKRYAPLFLGPKKHIST